MKTTATTVVDMRTSRYDIYIAGPYGSGPMRWGSPFTLGFHGTRAQVIAKYREWIKGKPELLAEVKTLKGKRLGCYCAPKACHGDVLAELADAETEAMEGK